MSVFPRKRNADGPTHLADNGMYAEIVDDVEGGTIPVDGEYGVRVLVPAADAEIARQVLDS